MIKKDYQLLVALLQELNTHQEVLLNGVYHQTFEDFEQDDLLFPALCERIRQDCIAVIRAGVVGVNPTQCLLTAIPPLERHPYLDAFPVNPVYRKYIIGTFPPISYLRDAPNFAGAILKYREVDDAEVDFPMIPFYHGNDATLWSILGVPNLRVGVNRESKKLLIVDFLQQREINYFDVIEVCQRKQYATRDKDLYNIMPNYNAISNLLIKEEVTGQKIETLVFNTSSIFGTATLLRQNVPYRFGEINDGDAWALNIFLKALKAQNKCIELGLPTTPLLSDSNNVTWYPVDNIPVNVNTVNAVFKNKVAIYLRVESKRIFRLITGPSPSGDANRGLANNAIFLFWLKQINAPLNNPIQFAWQLLELGKGVGDFKKFIYRTALFGNTDLLFQLNV